MSAASGMFRSESMTFCRITMTADASQQCMREIGSTGRVHLVDLNEEMAHTTDSFLFYKKRVLACFTWERRLKYIEEVMEANNVALPGPETPVEDIKTDDPLNSLQEYLVPREAELMRNLEFKSSQSRAVNTLREHVVVLNALQDTLFQGIEEVKQAMMDEERERVRSREVRHEIELDSLTRGRRSSSGDAGLRQSLLAYERKAADTAGAATVAEVVSPSAARQFHTYLCGVIPVLQTGAFERMLFRVSRGNAYVRFQELDGTIADPETGEQMAKAVFYVVYIGHALERRLTKMLDYFRASSYDVPDDPRQFRVKRAELRSQITEQEAVLRQTQSVIEEELNAIAWETPAHMSSPLLNWEEALRRERAVCDALKKCHAPDGSMMVTAEGWVPDEDVEEVRACVHRTGAQAAVEIMHTKMAPPTYFKTNKFTSNFQGIVDTYGVPRYQEVNPGLFTIITFPFLFGIMYGDIGHGSLMTLFGIYMVFNEAALARKKKLKQLGEIFVMLFNGRYLILLMGISAVYCGTIYNDCLSVPINAFGSGWEFNLSNGTEASLPPKHVYTYGVDPGWYFTKNELTYFNSLKMKISVTFGVVQMTFGIVLGLFNHLHFKNTLSIWFEWVPQMLFMLCTFGYMIFLIMYKFTIDWTAPGITQRPPSLIQTMIGMFLSPTSVEDPLFSGQVGVQIFLVLTAVLSIPWMLVPKPLLENYYHKKRLAERAGGASRPFLEAPDVEDPESQGSEAALQGGHGDDDDDEEEFILSEHFIHQSIHTIEFVLGCVSNTASYLRLWALSLAHAELSNVFWEKLIMEYGVDMGSPIFLFITFGAWAGATFAVLLCMDSLECFLHALRLHWVEFQNKFYMADGYAYEPFSFEAAEDD